MLKATSSSQLSTLHSSVAITWFKELSWLVGLWQVIWTCLNQ